LGEEAAPSRMGSTLTVFVLLGQIFNSLEPAIDISQSLSHVFLGVNSPLKSGLMGDTKISMLRFLREVADSSMSLST
jgi:hypothetical protein